MSDIDTVWNAALARGDYVLAGADLASGHDLMTSVLISLFSDRTARPDDVLPDASGDRRGWWADEGESYAIGSRLWLLDRSKLSQAVALKAVEYATEALQWMIDDGVVAAFDISTEIRLPATLILRIAAYRTKGQLAAKKYAWTWSGPVLYPVQILPQVRGDLVTQDGVFLVTEDGTQFTI